MPTKIVSKNKVFFCSSYSTWASLLLCNIILLKVIYDVAGIRRCVSSSWSAAWVSLPQTRKGKLTWWPCLKTAAKFRKSSYRWWMKTSPFLVLESWNGHQRSFTLFTKRIWRNSQTRCQLWWMKWWMRFMTHWRQSSQVMSSAVREHWRYNSKDYQINVSFLFYNDIYIQLNLVDLNTVYSNYSVYGMDGPVPVLSFFF